MHRDGDKTHASAAIALTSFPCRPLHNTKHKSRRKHVATGAPPLIAPPHVLPPGTRPTNPLRRLIQDNDTLRHIIAGTIARTISQLVIHPLDTVKTRLQVPPHGRTPQLRAWVRGVHAVRVRLPLMRMSIPNWAAKGVGDLYLGATGALLGTLPTAFVYFTVYEGLKKKLEQQQWCVFVCIHGHPFLSPNTPYTKTPAQV